MTINLTSKGTNSTVGQTFKEVFDEFCSINAQLFPKTLIRELKHALSAFNNLLILEYSDISNEMFTVLIENEMDTRKMDNMHYIIHALDEYLLTKNGVPVIHPPLTEMQAAWMILNEPLAMNSEVIKKRLRSISSAHLPIEVIGAIMLTEYYSDTAFQTIRRAQNAVLQLCNLQKPLSDICEADIADQSVGKPNPFHQLLCRSLRRMQELNNRFGNCQTVSSVSVNGQCETLLPEGILPCELTLLQLYEVWRKIYGPQYARSTHGSFRTGWNYLMPFWQREMIEIKIDEIQNLIDTIPTCSQYSVKYTFQKLEHTALALDVISKAQSQNLICSIITSPSRHFTLTEDDLRNLEQHTGEWYTDITVVLCYTGLRTGEFIRTKKSFVDLDMREIIIRGEHGHQGKNRMIPIHKNILPILSRWLSSNSSEWLFPNKNGGQLYESLVQTAVTMASSLYCSRPHSPYDCRLTFCSRIGSTPSVSAATKVSLSGIKPDTVDLMVYSHPSSEQLHEAINNI